MKSKLFNKLPMIISFFAAALILAAMFLFSSQTSDISAQTSGKVFDFIVNLLHIDETSAAFETLHTIIRKLAHFSLFFILGMSVSSSVHFSIRRLEIVISLLICLLAAIFDETHQMFVGGRSGEIRDVFIDFSGAVCGCLAFMLIIQLFKLLKKAKKAIGLTT